MRTHRLCNSERKVTKQTDYPIDNRRSKRDLDSIDLLKRWSDVGDATESFLKPRLDTVQTGCRPKANDRDGSPYPRIKENEIWEQEYL